MATEVATVNATAARALQIVARALGSGLNPLLDNMDFNDSG